MAAALAMIFFFGLLASVWIGWLVTNDAVNSDQILEGLMELATGIAREREHGQLQEYLTHTKPYPPRTLLQAYVWGIRVALGDWAFSYERGTPVRVVPC